MCRINPRVDFAFKKLFGSEENKDILISLINAIVSEKDQVVDLELQNPYNAKNYQNDKLSILDIKAKDSNNHWYNIEMQVADQKWYDKRALYYWAKIYNEQVRAGINYDQLTKTISINILNFNCLDEENYHNVYHILNDKTHSLLVDDLEMHFIELEKYDEKLVSILDRWVNFLKKAENYSQKYMPKELSDEPKIQKALEVLETINFSDDERESYEDRLKVLRDRINIIKTAEYKGRIAGLEEGRKEGLEEGKKEGIDEGKSESKIEIAKNLLELMDDPKISTITGLGIELIQKLRQDHAN